MNHAFYSLLPPTFKNIAVSVYGFSLYRRRYANKYFKKNIREITNRQHWDSLRLAEYQDKCVKKIIHIAANHVPYYRNLFQDLKLTANDINNRNDLVLKVPILEKSTIKKNPEQFVDERLNVRKLNKVFTSGTTGSPLCIYRDNEAEGMAYAFYEARWRLPYGITKDSSWAMLGGKLVISQAQEKPPFWVWNLGLKQLYMSAYHLSLKFAESYLNELSKRKVDYIHGYASALYSLAEFAEKIGYLNIKFKVAISNAEPLLNYQREKIEKVFNCHVVDTYGCAEWCVQLSECQERKLHISPDVGILEIVDSNGLPVEDGSIGQVVCTGFVNYAQPLIRYKIGDSAIMGEKKCRCGLAFPLIESIEGRNDDLIRLKDGRVVGRLDPIFKGSLPIFEAQIIQEKMECFTINVVPTEGWNIDSANKLKKSFMEYVGFVEVRIKIVDHILRTKTGKFRAVISNLK